MPSYVFRALFTASKVGVAPASAPTVDVCNGAGTLVATAGAAVAMTGITGLYGYVYTGAADEYVAIFKTTTTTVDLQHIPSWTPTVIYTNLDAAVSSRASQTGLDDIPTSAELTSAVAPLATAAALDIVDNLLDTEVGAIKTVTDQLATALELDGAVYRLTANALEQAPSGGSAPTAAAIADAVWDEAIAGHAVAGSTGQALTSAGAAADPLLNPVPGSYASGTAGAALGSLAGASVSIVSPVASDGTTIDLIFGDDYYAADGRALLFNAEGATLTGNPVYLRVRNNAGAIAIAGVVTGAHTCYFEVTSVQLSSIGVGEWRYDFEYILPTTHVITVVHDGIMQVKQDVR